MAITRHRLFFSTLSSLLDLGLLTSYRQKCNCSTRTRTSIRPHAVPSPGLVQIRRRLPRKCRRTASLTLPESPPSIAILQFRLLSLPRWRRICQLRWNLAISCQYVHPSLSTSTSSSLLNMWLLQPIASISFVNSWCAQSISEFLGKCGGIKMSHSHFRISILSISVGILMRWDGGLLSIRLPKRCRMII